MLINIPGPSGVNATFTIDTSAQVLLDLFNENYYRANLPASVLTDMDSGINSGVYVGGTYNGVPYSAAYNHWEKLGIKAGYSPCKFYDENTYLNNNSDVRAAVFGESLNPNPAVAYLPSGLCHWILWGRMELVTGSNPNRVSGAIVPTYTLTTGIDNFTADSSIGGKFVAADGTFNVGDMINGGTANLSTMTMSLSANNAAAGTMKNVGTVNIFTSAALSVDFTNISGVTAVNNNASSNTLTLNNLSIDPTIGLVSTNKETVVNYLDSVFTTNTSVPVNMSGISASTAGANMLTLSHTASGFFQTLNVASTGPTTNNLFSQTNGLFYKASSGIAGTALQGTTALNITGTTAFNGLIESTVSTIRTINAAPATALHFVDTTTGTASNAVNATFSTAGSKLQLTATSLATATGATNTISYTGSGNTLAIVSAAIPASSIAATITNLDTVEITDTLNATKSLNAANLSSGIKNLVLDDTTGGSAAFTISNLASTTTASPGVVTLNNATAALTPVAASLTTSQAASGTTNALTVNINGTGAGAAQTLTLNGVGSSTINLQSTVTTSQSIALGSDIMQSSVLTGGTTGVQVTYSALPASLSSLDASASLSGITATGTSLPSTLKGSHVDVNTLTGNTLGDTILGGAKSDTIDAKQGVNTVTLHYNGSTETNNISFSAFDNATTITDFNPGTSTTSTDLIKISHLPTVGGGFASLVQFGKGGGNAVTTSATATAANKITSYGAVTGGATDEVIILAVPGATNTASTLQAALNGGTNSTVYTFNTALTATYNAMPIVYLNTDGYAHVAAVIGASTATSTAAATVVDFAILQGVTSTNFSSLDATDFYFV